MLERQKRLWSQNIGSKVTLEQKELVYESSKSNFESAVETLAELERQLKYLARQAENNLLISQKNTGDFLVKSKIKGKVYQMNLAKGEIVTPQTPIAIIGDDEQYLLEMQIDEYDIVSVQLGMPVMIMLNSYKDSVFSAVVSKIYPIMNLQTGKGEITSQNHGFAVHREELENHPDFETQNWPKHHYAEPVQFSARHSSRMSG